MPIGCSPKFGGVFIGTIAVTGIASIFGKIAKGSVRVVRMVLSSTISRPLTVVAFPVAMSLAPRIG